MWATFSKCLISINIDFYLLGTDLPEYAACDWLRQEPIAAGRLAASQTVIPSVLLVNSIFLHRLRNCTLKPELDGHLTVKFVEWLPNPDINLLNVTG